MNIFHMFKAMRAVNCIVSFWWDALKILSVAILQVPAINDRIGSLQLIGSATNVEDILSTVAAGTPPDIVKKLSDALVTASKNPDVIKRIRDAGAAELGGSSEVLAKHIESEYAKWKKVIEAAKLEPQ